MIQLSIWFWVSWVFLKGIFLNSLGFVLGDWVVGGFIVLDFGSICWLVFRSIVEPVRVTGIRFWLVCGVSCVSCGSGDCSIMNRFDIANMVSISLLFVMFRWFANSFILEASVLCVLTGMIIDLIVFSSAGWVLVFIV